MYGQLKRCVATPQIDNIASMRGLCLSVYSTPLDNLCHFWSSFYRVVNKGFFFALLFSETIHFSRFAISLACVSYGCVSPAVCAITGGI